MLGFTSSRPACGLCGSFVFSKRAASVISTLWVQWLTAGGRATFLTRPLGPRNQEAGWARRERWRSKDRRPPVPQTSQPQLAPLERGDRSLQSLEAENSRWAVDGV